MPCWLPQDCSEVDKNLYMSWGENWVYLFETKPRFFVFLFSFFFFPPDFHFQQLFNFLFGRLSSLPVLAILCSSSFFFWDVLFCSVLFWFRSFLTLGLGPSWAPSLLPPVEVLLCERASISARQEMRPRWTQSPVVSCESGGERVGGRQGRGAERENWCILVLGVDDGCRTHWIEKGDLFQTS